MSLPGTGTVWSLFCRAHSRLGVALSRLVNVEGRQMTATQQRIQDCSEAAQQRMIARVSTAGGFRSLFGAQSYLWALGADPRFTDLLDSYPEASRLRNEARFALRYLHMDCRGPEALVLPAR